MALCGKKVFIYAIAPFVTQRCYEQLKVDISGMNLPVAVVGIGVGISYATDGPTHQAPQDMANIRALPNFAILTPSDSISASHAALEAYKSPCPVYVRLDKGIYPGLYDVNAKFSSGCAELRKGKALAIISTGAMVHQALSVGDELKGLAIIAGVLDLYRIKPLNRSRLLKTIAAYDALATYEEHSEAGGIGSAISELLTDFGLTIPLKRFALSDSVCEGHGCRAWIHRQHALEVRRVARRIADWRRGKL